MIHAVYEDSDYDYLPANDLLNMVKGTDGEEEKEINIDMKICPSFLSIVDDEEEDGSESEEEDEEELFSRIKDLGFSADELAKEVSEDDILDPDVCLKASRKHPPFGMDDKPKLERGDTGLHIGEEEAETFTRYFETHAKQAEAKLKSGEIVAEKAEGDCVDIRKQVDLEQYTDVALKQRLSVMMHPSFRALAKKLYDMLKDNKVRFVVLRGQSQHISNTKFGTRLFALRSSQPQAGHITKQTYLQFALRVNLVMVPTNKLDLEAAAKQADEDWEADVKLNEADQGTSGRFISWRSFYLSIFQLCDIWTTSSHVSKYIALLTKILESITLTNDGRMGFVKKEACHFDAFFNFLGDINIKKFDERQNNYGNVGLEGFRDEEARKRDISGKKIKKEHLRHR